MGKMNMYGISYFSSRGPTADGKAKPDLVAPGEHVFSCNAKFVSDPFDSLRSIE
jgi:serine protease AprX